MASFSENSLGVRFRFGIVSYACVRYNHKKIMERRRYSWNSEGKDGQIWSKCKHFDVLAHEWVSQMESLFNLYRFYVIN